MGNFLDPFIKKNLQCCDADGYVQYGIECANDNTCYGDLRPMGDYLWFSFPVRMGWPEESLIAANILAVLVGIILSVMALRKLLSFADNYPVGKSATFILFLISFGIHAVFLRPTIFNTLSDPPANMLLLSSVWLLILAHFNISLITRALQFLAAGICLGLAAWLRAFYLYPVLAGVFVFVLMWMFPRKKSWSELMILVSLLPIGAQYFVIHKAYGTYSYIREETTTSWADLHLNYPYIGFDTIFPRNGYFWQPQHCEAKLGILSGLEENNFKDVACVVVERLYFYLATYRSETYIFSSRKNQLLGEYAENIGDKKSDWFSLDLQWTQDVAMSPSGQMTADKLTVVSPKPGGAGDVVQWVQLRGHMPHTFSVWLWSPQTKTINLTIRNHFTETPVALKQFTLSAIPMRFSVTGITQEDGLYDVDIGRTSYADNDVSFGTEDGDFLYAWGAQLEVGEHATEYNGSEVASPDSVRRWSPWLLALNLCMLLIAVMAFVRYRTFWLKQSVGISIIAIFVAAAVECIAIIPEQRFAIGLMIFFWLIATTFVFMRAKRKYEKRKVG